MFARGALLISLSFGWVGLTAHGAGTVLTLWEHEKDEDQKVLDEVIQKFSKQFPDVQVKRSHYKTEDLRSQFQTAAMGGGGADIVVAPNDFAGPFSVMGIIQPVNDFGKLNRFFPSVVQAVTDGSGKTWGLPVSNGNHLMLFVNKKLVPEAPKTIEDLIIAAKKISNPENKKYGFAYNLNEPFWFVSFLGAFGDKPLNDKTPVLNTEGMVKALALVKRMKFEEKVVPPDCDYACADTLFVEGKVGMVINGDWAVQKYRDALGKDLILSALPSSKETGKAMAPMVSGKYVFFNAKLKGKKLDAAKQFAEFMVSEPIQAFFVQKSNRLPSVKVVGESSVVKGDPVVKATMDAMVNGQAMPMAVEMRAVWDAMRPQLQRVMAGRAEPQTAALTMQKDAESKIRSMQQ